MRASVTALSNYNEFRYVFYNIGLFDLSLVCMILGLRGFILYFGVTVIKSHLCVYSYVFILTNAPIKFVHIFYLYNKLLTKYIL